MQTKESIIRVIIINSIKNNISYEKAYELLEDLLRIINKTYSRKEFKANVRAVINQLKTSNDYEKYNISEYRVSLWATIYCNTKGHQTCI